MENHTLKNASRLLNTEIEIELKIARQVYRSVRKDRRERKRRAENVDYQKEFGSPSKSQQAQNEAGWRVLKLICFFLFIFIFIFCRSSCGEARDNFGVGGDFREGSLLSLTHF